jgi:hypothetical protein
MATGANFSAENEIKYVRARLRALETEQLALRDRLEELERQRAVFEAPSSALNTSATPPVTMASSSSAKVALFRRLFAGREDVVPNSLGESEDRKKRIRASLRERMGERVVQ